MPRVEIRSGELHFEFECPEELYLDWQAFAEAAGLTMDEVLAFAIEEGLPKEDEEPRA
jgi:hypothetical protein